MPLTSDQIQLVQKSFSNVKPITDETAAMFYNRLFQIAPHVKPLFKGEMKNQGKKLMDTLTIVIFGLNRIDTLLPTVHNLAKKHVSYGVRPEHYDLVGQALLWTLQQKLGAIWTDEVASAWEAAYIVIATSMKNHAYAAPD